MSKQQKRERRKIDRARRSRANAKAAGALAAGAAIAAGTQAYATPVRFDNPAHGEAGHFHWAPLAAPESVWLGMSAPASAQTGWFPSVPYGYMGFVQQYLAPSGDVSVFARRGEFVRQQGSRLLEAFAAGQQIGPSSGNWQSTADVRDDGQDAFTPGVPTYIALRLPLEYSFDLRYAWIGVIQDASTHTLETFAWGYETEIGVPVFAGAPEPGSLALLAFGVAAVARRRRSA